VIFCFFSITRSSTWEKASYPYLGPTKGCVVSSLSWNLHMA